MKTRTAGGIGIVLVGLGLLLGLMFRGPGFGGKGSGDGQPAGAPDANVKVSMDTGNTSSAPPSSDGISSEPGAGEDFVTILIHADGYRLVSSADPGQGVPITLEEILRRVQSVPGSPEGIRLRILKDRTAQEGARSDLEATLQKAGIKLEEVQEISGFVQ